MSLAGYGQAERSDDFYLYMYLYLGELGRIIIYLSHNNVADNDNNNNDDDDDKMAIPQW